MDGTTVTLDPSEVEDASKVPTLDASEVVDQSAAAPTIDSTMSMRDRPAQPSGSLKPLMEAPERSPYSDPGSAAFAAQTAGQPMQMGIKSQPQKTVGDVMDNRQEMHFEPVAQRALAQAPKPPVPAGLTAPDPRVAAVRSVPGVGIATTGKVGTDPLAGAVQATKAGAKEFKQGLDLLGPDNFADNSAEGAKQTAAGYTHLVNGLMTMTGPEVTMAVGADPLPFIKGLITGAITGEAAKKVVQAAGGSPEFQEFAKTAGFFLPSMVGALTGATSSKVPFGEGEAKVTDYAAPKGATAPGSGRVSTFSGSNPQEYAAGIRVGGRTMGVRIPRNGTITPQPPPDPAMQMHQAETSSAVQALSDGAAADANAARAAAGIPPPPPPKPPMPAGMDKGELRPAVVSNLAKMVQIAPPGMRAGMFLEAHAQLAGWLGTQRTVVLPDGKLQIIDSPKKAESVAQDILNDEVERHQQAHQDMQDQKADQQKEAQKAAEKQAKDEADQAESSQNEKGEEENPLINRARTLLAANADAPPARQAALLQRQLRVGPGLAQRLLVAARTSQQAPGTGNVVGSSTHPVTEEPREQIERQMASLAGGTVPVVHLPEGTQHRPAVPPGMKMIRVTGDVPGAGMYIYNPAKIQAAAIKEAAKNGTHGDLLGHIAQKEDLGAMKVPAVLQASTADGQPIQESIVDAADPEMVRAQADALRERHPGAHIQARHPDMAMAERDHAIAREATGGGDIFDHIAQQRGKEAGHAVQEQGAAGVLPHAGGEGESGRENGEGVRQGEQGRKELTRQGTGEKEVTQAQGSEGGRGAPEPGEGRSNAAPKPEEIQGWRDAIANAKKLRGVDAAAVNKLIGEIEGKPGTYKAGDKLSDDDRSAVEGNLDTAENPAGSEPADEKQMDPADLERMPPEKIMPAPERKVYGNKVDGQKGGKDLPQIQPAEAKRRIQSWKDEAARIGREEDHSNEVVLSLFDRTGEWSKPYRDAGYDVRQYDIANGDDLMAFFPIADITAINAAGKKIVGVLGAPPCTSFAVSGARWWKDEHDAKNTAMVEKKYGAWAAQYFDTPLEYAKALVAITQAVIEFANPSQFHAVENPIGRFGSANDLPDPLLTFDPANYGDPYTKRTQLWGDFKANLPTANVEASLGSRIHQLRGNVPEQKAARSTTPEGFSYAFFMANHEKPIAAEKPAVADRRVNAAQRQRVSEMSPEEMRRTLLTSDKTGLPNRRAFEDAEHATPAKAIAMSDADGLKALNDKYGYEAGDKLLKAKAEELQAAGVEAYHDKGDEFLYRGDSPADLDRKLEAAREGLRNREIQVTMKDGSVRTFKGADFSYGAGKDANAAESKLKQHKADREAKGERARGELRGIQETGPKEDRGRESTAPKTAIAKGDKGIRFRDDHGVERTGTVLHTNDRITRLRLGSGAENTVKNADVLGARTVPEPGGIGELHSSQMERAPKDFQYKMSNIGEGGVSNLLKGSEWNRDLSGIVSAWRDPANGKVYVVNGHHRHERAEATGGQNLAVRMLEVKNREEARAIGALQNIAEGRGTAIDAAKFIRSSGMTLEDLEKKGISLGEATAQNGVALARLDPSIFEQVATGKLSERKGVAIGRATDNAATQEAIVKMIAKAEARGRHVGEGMVQELARFAASAGEHEQTVESLFGNKVETQNLALEKADVSAYIQKQLRQEKTAFGAVSSEARAKTLSRTGNKIEAKKNALEATAATQALEVYDRLSARRGPVDDALNEAAREIADGKPANNAKQRAYDAIRVAVHEALGSVEGEGTRGVQEDSGRGPGAGEEEEKRPSAQDLEDAGQGGITFTRQHGPLTPQPRLVALHNTSAEGIKAADKLGGIPAPSLAIMKEGEALNTYGPISLVGNRAMVDPATNPHSRLYDADVYSPRQPRPSRQLVKKAIENFEAKIRGAMPADLRRTFLGYGLSDSFNTFQPERFDELRENYARSAGVQYAWLRSIDKAPEITAAPPELNEKWLDTPALRAWVKDHPKFDYYDQSDQDAKQLAKLARDAYVKHFADGDLEQMGKEIWADRYADSDDPNKMAYGPADRIARDLRVLERAVKGEKEIDRRVAENTIEDGFKRETATPEGREAFDAWLRNGLDGHLGPEYLQHGKAKKEYSLKNVLQAMIGAGIRGREQTMFQGLGKSRSENAKQFKSIEALRKEADRIVGDKQAEADHKILSDRFHAWQNQLPYKYQSQFDALDHASQALSDFIRSRSHSESAMEHALAKNDYDADRITSEQVREGMKIARDLQNASAEYFEAKLKNAVALSEFSGAVVPHDADQETFDVLAKHGIPVERYSSYSKDDRLRAIHQLQDSAEGGIFFSPAPSITPASPFYLKSARVIASKMQGPMKGADLIKMLENAGVKAEEIKWTGLGELAGEVRVTPDQVRDVLAQDRVELTEIVKGGELPEPGGWDSVGTEPESTNYSRYQLSGGQNYREMLLQLPASKAAQREQELETEIEESKHILESEIDNHNNSDDQDQWPDGYFDERRAEIRHLENELRRVRIERRASVYESPHWDEPNILTHIRYNDRTDADGKKLLHLEELQSDWHQKGRANGYGDPAALDAARAEHDRAQEKYQEADRAYEKASMGLARFAGGDIPMAEQLEVRRLRQESKDALIADHAARNEVNRLIGAAKIPDAPFKKTWHELALRRMLHHAAENGYDGLSWTPGEKQGERYDLSKQISKVMYHVDTHSLQAFDNDRKLVIDQGIPVEDLPDYIGKEGARKLMDSPTTATGYKLLEGVDLKVGGEGMKGFYDQIVPAYLNKLGRQWGAKVGETQLGTPGKYETPKSLDWNGDDARTVRIGATHQVWAPNANGADQLRGAFTSEAEAKDFVDAHTPGVGQTIPAPYLPITDAMRKSVTEEGQPMFSPAKLDATPEQRAKAQRLTTSDPKFHYLDGPGVAKLYQKNLRGVVLEGETPSLPGLEQHLEEHQKSAEEVSAEALKQAGAKDISGAAGRMERDSPLFRDSGASEQGALFTKPKPPQRGTGQGAINFDVPEGFKELSPEKRMIYFHKAARANNFSLGYNLIHGRLTVHPPTVEGGPPVVEMNEHAYQAINKLKQADRPLALADWGGVFMTAPHARRLEAMLEEQKTKLLGAGSEMLAELSKGYAPGGGMILVRSDIGANGVREEMAHWWFSQNIENDPSVARDMADALISSPVVQRAIRQLMLQGYPIKTMAETFLLNECLAKTLADPGGELMPLHPDDLRELLDQALNYLHREMTTVTFRRTLDALPDISPKARAIIDAWRQSNDDPGRQPLSTTEPEGRISDIQGNRESSGRPPPQGRDAGLLFTPQRDGAEPRGRDEVARQRDLPDEGADEEMSPLENFMGAITDYIHSDQELTEGKLQRGIMRETRGQMDRRIAQTATALEKDRSRWARKSHDEFLKFADAVEKVGGAKVSDLDPKDQKLAQYFQDQYWKRIETIRALKEGALQDLIENYISHNWERPGLAKSTLKQVFSGRRPFAGRGSFLKQRTIPTIREGIELGLRPKTWNPVEDFLHKILDMDRFIMGHQTMMGMKQAGTAKMVRIGQRPPEGWQQLDDRIGTVQSKSDDGGLVLRGHYYAPADAAKPFNNFVSRGVAGKSQIYDTLRWANDNMNALQLGISFFHAMTTTNNAIAADVALGVQELSRGQVLSGTGRLARGVTLVPSVVQTFRNGSKLMKEYLSPGSYAKFAEEANALAVAGGRPKMDVLQPKPLQQIINHFRNGEVFRGGGKVLGSIIHATTAPVLDYWVPRMKVGAFYADAHSVLEYSRKRGWTPERTRAEIQKAWDSADHRFGQVVYDNLFWHKALRDMLQLTQRAVGWNYGTAAGVGGAIPEAARAAGRVATGDVGEFGTLLGRAMSFVIGMTLATGLMGALLEYHWQKHGPRQAKDFFFPQRPDGQRVSIPGYMKDVFAFGHAPLQTVLNKLAPVFAAMAELYQNRDFYRVEIRHSDDNWLEQATEVGKYIGRTLEPFSARAQVKMLESQGAGVNNGAMGMLHAVLAHPEDAALGQLGFQPAAAYIQNTPAQNMAYEYSSENNPPGTRTREQFERSQIKQAIAAMHRTGHVDQAQIQKYVRAGQITPKDVREAAANAHTDPLVLTVRHGDLSLQQMLNVYLKANPGEKLKLKPMLARKAKSLQEIPNPETRRALGAELRKALGSATSEAVHADDSAWERPAMQY